MSLQILGGDGDPVAPAEFTRQLKAFDPNLRVIWGSRSYAKPVWVIERKVPPELYYKTYFKGKDPERDRYAEQVIYTEDGKYFGMRLYDMMPEWHPVYFVINARGEKLELGVHVIDHLRKNYERTLLGIPELSLKHLVIDRQKVLDDRERRKEKRLEDAAREVMAHKTEIWSEYFAFGGQAKTVLPGTEAFTDTGESKCVN